MNATDQIIAQAIRITIIVCIPYEIVIIPVVQVQPAAISADPKIVFAVFINSSDPIVAYTGAVINDIFINFKMCAIVSVQTMISAKPHKTFTILENIKNSALRKTFVQMSEFDIGLLGMTAYRQDKNEKNLDES